MTGLDLDARRLLLDRGEPIDYDYLVLATGSTTADFAIPGVSEHAPLP